MSCIYKANETHSLDLMRNSWLLAATLVAPFACLAVPAWAVQEFYVGEPVVKEGMQIVPNYLTGVEMSPMPAGMAMGPNAVHLEADVHATNAESHGFSEDAWIPYLTISYVLSKDGAPA